MLHCAKHLGIQCDVTVPFQIWLSVHASLCKGTIKDSVCDCRFRSDLVQRHAMIQCGVTVLFQI